MTARVRLRWRAPAAGHRRSCAGSCAFRGTAMFQNFIGHGVVHGPGPDHRRVRQRGCRRQHHRHPHHPVRAAAVLGRQQRRGDAASARTSAPGNPTARRLPPGRPGCTTRSVSERSAWSFCSSPRSSSGIFTNDEAVRSAWRPVPADRLGGLSVLRIRDGADGRVQRRGRHADADLDQPGQPVAPGSCRSRGCSRIPQDWGRQASFVAMSVGFSTLAFLSAWIFSKGHWKTRQV